MLRSAAVAVHRELLAGAVRRVLTMDRGNKYRKLEMFDTHGAAPPPLLFSLCRSVRYETLIGKEGVRREEKEGEGRRRKTAKLKLNFSHFG